MSSNDCPPLEVSRRIGAPAGEIFRILASPSGQVHIDGSGMLQAAVSTRAVAGVGDVFVMAMRSSKWGDYEINNHVVEYDADRLIAWEPHAGNGHPDADLPRHGHRWTYRLEADGPDATVVTEIYDCSRAPEELRANVSHGELWRESMMATLERLEALCTAGRSREL
jgi:Polyketide cyclase / dehydrase and lipid transport